MKLIRQRSKSTSVFLVILMVLLTTPCQSVLAAMIETEASLASIPQGQAARNTIKALLAREDARAVLRAQGINPVEAMARVDSLTDEEIENIATRMDQLPAGGDAFGVIVGAALIVFIVLLVTDILGLTDVFTFVKKR